MPNRRRLVHMTPPCQKPFRGAEFLCQVLICNHRSYHTIFESKLDALCTVFVRPVWLVWLVRLVQEDRTPKNVIGKLKEQLPFADLIGADPNSRAGVTM